MVLVLQIELYADSEAFELAGKVTVTWLLLLSSYISSFCYMISLSQLSIFI